MGELKRYLVNLIKGATVSEFGVEESVLNTFFLFGIYKLILIKTGRGDSRVDGVVDNRLQQISSISFFKDLTVL